MHIPKTQGEGGDGGGGILSTNLVLIKVASDASAGPGRWLDPLRKPQQPLCSFCELHWAPALMASAANLPQALGRYVKISANCWTSALFLFHHLVKSKPPSLQVTCACATHVPVTDQCIPAWVKSHPAIASTFLYRNNIIVNYLWPNLFCYNFPVE